MQQVGFSLTLPADGPGLFCRFGSDCGLVDVACDSASGTACALIGRLHYKKDLCVRFPACAQAAGAGDAQLALAAFLQHGTRGLEALEGEFSVVVVDPAQRRLLARRDPLGLWPLYWASRRGEVCVATSLLELARWHGQAHLNVPALAAFLMWPFAGAEQPTRDTVFHSLQRVRPGQLLQIGSDGNAQVLAENIWPAGDAERTDITPAEAGRQFRHLFQQAVHERLGPGVNASHLSGGMDSSSVFCMARDFTDVPLATLSLVYDMPSLAGETEYIRRVLAPGRPVDTCFIQGDDLLDFAWFDDEGIPAHDAPYTGLCQLAMERALARKAAEAGARTVFNGGGAEVSADGSRFHLADLLRQGRWPTAWREVRRWASATNVSSWSVLCRQGLSQLMPVGLRDGAGTWLRGGRARWPHVGPSAVPPWIQDGFARKYRMWSLGQEAMGLLCRAPYERTANEFAIQCDAGEWSAWHLAGPLGVQTARPFLDPRLLRFSLSLPRDVRVVPGTPKPILQEAMKGILPEAVRTRRYKANFNDMAWRGLARHLHQLEDMVRRSTIADLDMLDVDSLLAAMRQTAAGVGDLQGCARINSTLALVAWHDRAAAELRRPAAAPAESFEMGSHSSSLVRGLLPC